jgi:hypothetical protein
MEYKVASLDLGFYYTDNCCIICSVLSFVTFCFVSIVMFEYAASFFPRAFANHSEIVPNFFLFRGGCYIPKFWLMKSRVK